MGSLLAENFEFDDIEKRKATWALRTFIPLHSQCKPLVSLIVEKVNTQMTAVADSDHHYAVSLGMGNTLELTAKTFDSYEYWVNDNESAGNFVIDATFSIIIQNHLPILIRSLKVFVRQ